MNPHDFAVLVSVGAIGLLAMLAAAAIVEAVGRSRLAAWLRLPTVGDDE